MSFGTNVRAARETLRMTQLELGRISGYGRTSIANIEADRQDPPLHGLYAIAKALRVTPASLLSGELDSDGSREALQMRQAVQKALRMLDWEVERLTNTADSLRIVASTLRQSLGVDPASGDSAASVAQPGKTGTSQSGQEPAT